MTNEEYWRRREEEALQNYLNDEEEYSRRINQIYTDMYDACNADIEAFYGRYAAQEGITLAEARRRVSQLDIEEYERKAERYVRAASRDRAANYGRTNYQGYYFSERANEEMRLYNLTMKVNRLEMLKANLGLEMVKGHAELETFMESILRGRTEDELRRQAGIMGKTIVRNAKLADTIVHGSFHNATFSDRIWQYHDLMKADLSRLLQQGMIQGKGARELAGDLRKYFIGEPRLKNGKSGAKYATERLMRTELARVQTAAQKAEYEENGLDEYKFIANSKCCSVCQDMNGNKYKTIDMMPGLNAPPMHPHCRCSTAGTMDYEAFDEMIEYIANGGTEEEWNRLNGRKR